MFCPTESNFTPQEDITFLFLFQDRLNAKQGGIILLWVQISVLGLSSEQWNGSADHDTRTEGLNTVVIQGSRILQAVFKWNYWHHCHSKNILPPPIQVVRYNSLIVACQNVPITSILTDFALGSWKYTDVGLWLTGSKEMIWKTSFDM